MPSRWMNRATSGSPGSLDVSMAMGNTRAMTISGSNQRGREDNFGTAHGNSSAARNACRDSLTDASQGRRRRLSPLRSFQRARTVLQRPDGVDEHSRRLAPPPRLRSGCSPMCSVKPARSDPGSSYRRRDEQAATGREVARDGLVLSRRRDVGDVASSATAPVHRPAATSGARCRAAPPETARPVPARTLLQVAATPLHFERNDGQGPSGVRFMARGAGYSVHLSDTDASILLTNAPRDGSADARRSSVVRARLVGASTPRPSLARPPCRAPSTTSVATTPRGGSRACRRSDESGLPRVYPGIDVVYYGNQRQLQYDFDRRAGSRPDAHRARVRRRRPVSRSSRWRPRSPRGRSGAAPEEALHLPGRRRTAGRRSRAASSSTASGSAASRSATTTAAAARHRSDPDVLELLRRRQRGDRLRRGARARRHASTSPASRPISPSLPTVDAFQPGERVASPTRSSTKFEPNGDSLSIVFSSYLGGTDQENNAGYRLHRGHRRRRRRQRRT